MHAMDKITISHRDSCPVADFETRFLPLDERKPCNCDFGLRMQKFFGDITEDEVNNNSKKSET